MHAVLEHERRMIAMLHSNRFRLWCIWLKTMRSSLSNLSGSILEEYRNLEIAWTALAMGEPHLGKSCEVQGVVLTCCEPNLHFLIHMKPLIRSVPLLNNIELMWSKGYSHGQILWSFDKMNELATRVFLQEARLLVNGDDAQKFTKSSCSI